MKGEKGNIPSTPFTPIASTILWVSLNGTFSGISNVLPCPISLNSTPPSAIEQREEEETGNEADLIEKTIQINVDSISSQ